MTTQTLDVPAAAVRPRSGPRPATWRSVGFVSLVLASAVLVSGCSTSPLGRRQIRMMPEAQMSEMGVGAFQEIKKTEKLDTDAATNSYVRCITDQILGALDGQWAGRSWEVAVFDNESANAFALPGGKIGVYTGILEVAVNQDQLATVLAHEVGHVLAAHANERVSTSQLTGAALQVLSSSAGVPQGMYPLLGVGAQVGVLLPFGRAQETEADLIGLDLMAAAGFDPAASVGLWENMAKAGGAKPPEFMSTHPSHSTRISELNARMARSRAIYDKAVSAGRRPNCRR